MFTSLNANDAECAQHWFYQHNGTEAATAMHEQYPQYTGAAVLRILISRNCPLTPDHVEERLDRADEALDSVAADLARRRAELLRNACRLPDGRPIFVSEDGRSWFYEDRTQVPASVAARRTCPR